MSVYRAKYELCDAPKDLESDGTLQLVDKLVQSTSCRLVSSS